MLENPHLCSPPLHIYVGNRFKIYTNLHQGQIDPISRERFGQWDGRNASRDPGSGLEMGSERKVVSVLNTPLQRNLIPSIGNLISTHHGKILIYFTHFKSALFEEKKISL